MLVDVLVHAGYALMLVALLARDMLWLRLLLVGAQGLLAIYAFTHGVPEIGAWNAGFVVINAIWVVRILRERRAVRLPDDLRRLHECHFAALTAPEFLRLWQSGRHKVVEDAPLTRAGERPASLYFVLDGQVAVRRDGDETVRLGRGCFVGEMSLLIDAAATADAVALGRVEVRAWPVARLLVVRTRNPALWARIQSVLGCDLVAKIQRAQRASGASSADGVMLEGASSSSVAGSA